MIAKVSFSCQLKIVSFNVDWTSWGRLFQSRGPAAERERSPWLVVKDGRQEVSK